MQSETGCLPHSPHAIIVHLACISVFSIQRSPLDKTMDVFSSPEPTKLFLALWSLASY